LSTVCNAVVRGARGRARRPRGDDRENYPAPAPTPAPVDPEIVELASPASPAPPSIPSSRPESSGIAHLRGRVLFPAGTDATSDVVVVAEDGARRLHAHVQEGGRYQIHLPPGRYTLVASADDLVGVVPDVLARGDVHDIDIRLGPARRSGQRADQPTPPSAPPPVAGTKRPACTRRRRRVRHRRTDSRPPVRSQLHRPGLRTLNHHRRDGPGRRLEVALQARAKSAVRSVSAGSRCPITASVCESTESPRATTTMTRSRDVGTGWPLRAVRPRSTPPGARSCDGTGWYLEERVAIPTAGDPAPICLNPPLRSEPPLASPGCG
jgi:hypothetical protein